MKLSLWHWRSKLTEDRWDWDCPPANLVLSKSFTTIIFVLILQWSWQKCTYNDGHRYGGLPSDSSATLCKNFTSWSTYGSSLAPPQIQALPTYQSLNAVPKPNRPYSYTYPPPNCQINTDLILSKETLSLKIYDSWWWWCRGSGSPTYLHLKKEVRSMNLTKRRRMPTSKSILNDHEDLGASGIQSRDSPMLIRFACSCS